MKHFYINLDDPKANTFEWGNTASYLFLLYKVTNGLDEKRLAANSDGDLIVALRFLPNIELIVTILALTKCGLAYVPIAPNWPAGRIRLILQNAKPAMGRFFFEFE